MFGALISKVARLIDSRNPQAKAFKANMDELKAFMEEIALPNALKIKTKEAYAYYLNKKSSFGESGIFSELPKPVLYKLVFQLYKSDFQAVKLLKTYDAAFVVDLVIHARPFQAVKDEIIFAEGDVCNDIVLISRGRTVTVHSQPEQFLTAFYRSNQDHHYGWCARHFVRGGDGRGVLRGLRVLPQHHGHRHLHRHEELRPALRQPRRVQQGQCCHQQLCFVR